MHLTIRFCCCLRFCCWFEIEKVWGCRSRALRGGYVIVGLLIGWQWIATLVLTGIYLFGFRAEALRGWSWPFFATFALPVFVFVLILFSFKRRRIEAAGGCSPLKIV